MTQSSRRTPLDKMQLSKFTDYSFRALIYLAKNQDKRCTADMLAEQLEASPHHMKKVLHKLAGRGYVLASKGRVGGLHLARDPKEINLAEILKLSEENMALFECYNVSCRSCPLGIERCKLKSVSQRALRRFIGEFSNYTLKDIL